MPAQLQASSGWINVLSICCVVALNGSFGVRVGVGGRGVRVGGTSDTGVFVKKGVKVGRGVLLGVNSRVGLAVHVGSNCSAVTVAVGTLGPNPPGGSGFKLESGLMKIQAKKTTRQTVRINTVMERISNTCIPPPLRGAAGLPSKLKSSLIEIAP
jgi:hypothetical protein